LLIIGELLQGSVFRVLPSLQRPPVVIVHSVILVLLE
jgi:hypothetical protein